MVSGKKNITQFWQIAKDNNLCYRCLGKGHRASESKKTASCSIMGCNKTHHQLLQILPSPTVSPTAPPLITERGATPLTPTERSETSSSSMEGGETSVSAAVATQMTMTSNKNNNVSIALRTVPVIIKAESKRIQINALLDDGSTSTYVNNHIVDHLQITGTRQTVNMEVMNGNTTTITTMPVDLQIESLDGQCKQSICAYTPDHVFGKMEEIKWTDYSHNLSHMENIPFPKIEGPIHVAILIGVDNAHLIHSIREVVGEPGQPIARLTPLVWTAVGGPDSNAIDVPVRSHFIQTSKQHDELNETVSKFWELDSVGVDTTNHVSDWSPDESVV